MAPEIYVEVILPVPVSSTFTYRVPGDMAANISVGSRVIVPFGRRKFYTGIVCSFAAGAPEGFEIKDVISVPDTAPVVRHPQIKFWQWMADYYMCATGDVFRAAVPAGLKIESETRFELNPDFDETEQATLTERETVIWRLLSEKNKLTAKEIETHTGFRTISAIMTRMCNKGAVVVSESLVNRYRPKRENYVRVSIDRESTDQLDKAFALVKGAPKQEAMLLTLLQMSNFTNKGKELTAVKVSDLLERSRLTSSILKAIVDKGLAQRYTLETSRFRYDGRPVTPPAPLSPAQEAALNGVHAAFAEKNVTLLHGVTSSGKTEIYTHLINYVLEAGKQVLYLVPEIALTTQLTSRLQRVFGDRLLVYHSKFTDNERVEIWNRLLRSNTPCVVVGARSAVFMPFAKLGLVVVDEEHEQSYKQFDPAPRYNARDSAIMLAHMHGAKTLLGSATPSVETYYKALNGKYALVTLSERYNDVELPTIEIIDLAVESKRKNVKGSFAMPLVAAVRETVLGSRQAILFHNRRGFAPMALCKQCQYIPKCHSCDVSLTYHRNVNMLVCHYCGATYPLPETCPSCKEPALEVVGYGTERIEDETEQMFTEARTLRMDLDTTRNKNSYEKIIQEFSSHKADILVGTQMVTKGLDFGDVALVGVLNADVLINFPDFRAAERAFNMLEQVSGRAGRRDKRGRVLIQTRNPQHPVIGFVKNHDYEAFYNHEIAERRAFAYPPFTRMIYIYIKHKDERELDDLAAKYGDELRRLFGTRVSGPAKPGVSKVQLYHIRQLMLKFELEASMQKVREILRQLYASMHTALPALRQAIVYHDVDPS